MLMVVSPAKTLDFETPVKTKTFTIPDFLDDSQCLINQLRDLSPADISNLMGISDKLANLNYERNLNWCVPFDTHNAKQAVMAFKGDVYTGLDASSFSHTHLTFAQKHLRVLSGLYGVLRPLDLIQAYRLEMGVKFKNNGGSNLYEFWGEKLTHHLNEQLKNLKSQVLVNLASQEYFKVIQKRMLNAEVITPVFKDMKNGKYKIISFYAKKARGLMAAYVIKNKITEVDDLKLFDSEDYRYSNTMSTAREWVFIRG